MTAKDLLVNDGSYRKAIETICECLPQLDIVSALACRVTKSLHE